MCLLSGPTIPLLYSFEIMHLGMSRNIDCSHIYRCQTQGRTHRLLLNSTVDTHLQSPYHWLFRSEDKQTLEVTTRWTATNNAVQKTAKGKGAQWQILSPGSSQTMNLTVPTRAQGSFELLIHLMHCISGPNCYVQRLIYFVILPLAVHTTLHFL